MLKVFKCESWVKFADMVLTRIGAVFAAPEVSLEVVGREGVLVSAMGLEPMTY
jgi:hypothetical protein